MECFTWNLHDPVRKILKPLLCHRKLVQAWNSLKLASGFFHEIVINIKNNKKWLGRNNKKVI